MEPIVIVALIAGIASIGGGVIVALSARGKNKVDYKTALDTRIDQRVTEQLSSAWEQIDAQKELINGLTEQNGRQARIERVLFRYVHQLRSAIHDQQPPPPPTMPLELVDWYNLNRENTPE